MFRSIKHHSQDWGMESDALDFSLCGWLFFIQTSLLAEVSHDEAKWNERRETSAGFRRVSYHACACVSLRTSNVLSRATQLRKPVWVERDRERLLNLSARTNFKWTNQSWGWNDLASGRCCGPHHKPLRKAEEASFKANFLFFTSISTAEAHVFGVNLDFEFEFGIWGELGVNLLGFMERLVYCDSGLFFLRRKRFMEWHLANDGWSGFPDSTGRSRQGKN